MATSGDAGSRRAARAAWPGELHRDGSHPRVDVSSLSAAARLAALWSATRAAWALTGNPLPAIARAEWPGRVIRPE